MKIHRYEDLSPSDPPKVDVIDAATYGWIEGVTRCQGPAEFAVEKRLHPLDQLPGLKRALVISADKEVALALRPGTFRQRAWPLSNHPPRWIYRTQRDHEYDLWDLVRVHVGRYYLDPRPALWPMIWLPVSAICEDGPVMVAYRIAARLIEDLETTFARVIRMGRNPPVFVEGGLDLFARTVGEVAARMGLRVWAIENCWIPDHVLVAGETGAAVNRWNLAAPLALGSWPVPDDVAQEIEKECIRAEEVGLAKAKGQDAVPDYPRVPGVPVVLVLGQIPFDASIVDQNPDGVFPEMLPGLIAQMTPGPIQIRYRPHPLGCPRSAIDGTTEMDRVLQLSAEHTKIGQEIVISTGTSLRGELYALRTQRENHAVVTVNSQAGWQAARTLPVHALAPAWYSRSPLVQGAARLAMRAQVGFPAEEEPFDRRREWLAFTARTMAGNYFRRGADLEARLYEIVKGDR